MSHEQGVTEANLEDVARAWFESRGYNIAFGPACERRDYDQVVLIDRLRTALESINPNIPADVMIVCMSRRICVEMYNAIVKLRPDWHSDDDDKGVIKIVMSGSPSDRSEWQPHIRKHSRREVLSKRFKDPDDPMKLVMVRGVWLTGFDFAQELIAAVRRSVTIDWTVRENARAQIRVIVKRILRKYGYPPDKQEKATQTVLEQAEVLCAEWV